MAAIVAARRPALWLPGRQLKLRSSKRRPRALPPPRRGSFSFGGDRGDDNSVFELGTGWAAPGTAEEEAERPKRWQSYRERYLSPAEAQPEPSLAPVPSFAVSSIVERLSALSSAQEAPASPTTTAGEGAGAETASTSSGRWPPAAAGMGVAAAVVLFAAQLHAPLQPPAPPTPANPLAPAKAAAPVSPASSRAGAPALLEASSRPAPELRTAAASPAPPLRDAGRASVSAPVLASDAPPPGPSAPVLLASASAPPPSPPSSAPPPRGPPPPPGPGDLPGPSPVAQLASASPTALVGALAALPALLLVRAITSFEQKGPASAPLEPLPLQPQPEVSAVDAIKRRVLNELEVSAACIPHPDKVEKGGEDAFGVIREKGFVALADGVGGWGDDGVDPAAYSQALVANCVLARENGASDPLQVLTQAHAKTKVLGSATAVVLQMERGKARTAIVGDSGVLQCRRGAVVFASAPQQHRFNCPYQLGDLALVPEADSPASAMTFDLPAEPGDFFVVATDGVFDNVFPDEIAELCETYGSADAAVEAITVLAFQRSQDPKFASPFALAARIEDQRELQEYRRGNKSLRARFQEIMGLGVATGGKPDDITCVVLQCPK